MPDTSHAALSANEPPYQSRQPLSKGQLIVNADDWGQDRENTDRTLDCVLHQSLSSVSAMVFMKDSERAAEIARERGIDAGLHLNFTTMFSDSACSPRLLEQQNRLSRYLRSNRLARTLYHPGLAASFEYVVKAQIQEFQRLYGVQPERIDGHHHMHLCANVLVAGLLPNGTVIRRNFCFRPGEKSVFNRLYRKAIDRVLARRHRVVDYLFSLPPIATPGRLQRICSLANESVVELETHPVNPEEHRFLCHGESFRQFADVPVASRFAVPRTGCIAQGVC